MAAVQGTLVRASAIMGLPVARIRWAVPEEIMSGDPHHVIGRKTHSAAHYKSDPRNHAAALATQFAMWGYTTRAAALLHKAATLAETPTMVPLALPMRVLNSVFGRAVSHTVGCNAAGETAGTVSATTRCSAEGTSADKAETRSLEGKTVMTKLPLVSGDEEGKSAREEDVSAASASSPVLKLLRPPRQATGLSFDISDAGLPNQFFCPISHEVMTDPVVAADGHTYAPPPAPPRPLRAATALPRIAVPPPRLRRLAAGRAAHPSIHPSTHPLRAPSPPCRTGSGTSAARSSNGSPRKGVATEQRRGRRQRESRALSRGSC